VFIYIFLFLKYFYKNDSCLRNIDGKHFRCVITKTYMDFIFW